MIVITAINKASYKSISNFKLIISAIVESTTSLLTLYIDSVWIVSLKIVLFKNF